jgi:hypothetical protein
VRPKVKRAIPHNAAKRPVKHPILKPNVRASVRRSWSTFSHKANRWEWGLARTAFVGAIGTPWGENQQSCGRKDRYLGPQQWSKGWARRMHSRPPPLTSPPA